jgi:regulator of protease activity HflC (stomatin/prohibitin superfamily)
VNEILVLFLILGGIALVVLIFFGILAGILSSKSSEERRRLLAQLRTRPGNRRKTDYQLLKEHLREKPREAEVRDGMDQWKTVLHFTVIYGILIILTIVTAFVAHWIALVTLLVLLGGWVAVYNLCFKEIPPVHFAIVIAFGGRLVIVLREGAHWVWPWWRIASIEQEVVTVPFEFKATTKGTDRISLIHKGSVQLRAYHVVTDSQGRNRYFELDRETIRRGIVDTLQSVLGVIAGASSSSDYYEKRGVVSLIVDSTLELGRDKLPHLAGQRKGLRTDINVADLHIKKPHNFDEEYANLSEVDEENQDIPEMAVLRFYEVNQVKIRELLADQGSAGQSHFERTYGVDVITFALSDVLFTEETERRLEAVGQATLLQEEAEQIKPIIEMFRAQGSRDPVAAAMNFINRAKQINIEGSGGTSPFVVLKGDDLGMDDKKGGKK